MTQAPLERRAGGERAGLAAGAATIGAALSAATARLREAGIESPRREARLLLAELLGVDAGVILTGPERPLSAEESGRFDDMIAARARRVPVSRILGRREFWSLTFAVSGATLDPRPDSETLVEAVLARVADRRAPLRVLDLGTGTGCLLLALLHELPNATGVGVDRAPEAAATARANARALGLAGRAAFLAGDWTDALEAQFEIVVCNPPYVVSNSIAELAPEVALHDPRRALDGGTDGLAAYRALAPGIARVLAPRGLAALEIGLGQDRDVTAVLNAAGYRVDAVVPDLSALPRCVIATQPSGFRRFGEKPVGSVAYPD